MMACLEGDDFASMVRAVMSNDTATLSSLLAAKKCVRWPAGTRLFLNGTIKGTGRAAIQASPVMSCTCTQSTITTHI